MTQGKNNSDPVPQQPSGWQPIDTAPRDGTIIELTWMENGKPQEIWPMCWNVFAGNSLVQPHKGIWCMRQPNGRVQATWSEYNDGGGPTHWREIDGEGTA